MQAIKQNSIENVIREFKRRGYRYELSNQGIHIRLQHSGLIFDVYPTTGTWFVQGRHIKGKTILSLYDYINSLGTNNSLTKKIESKKEESEIETFNRLLKENRNSKEYLLSINY